MTDWLDDFRFAGRLLRRNPGFAATAVAALALGIGANSAIFSVINAVMFRPLPYPDPGRLVTVWETYRDTGAPPAAASKAPVQRDRRPRTTTIATWRRESRSFESLGGYGAWEFTLTGGGEPERVASGLADASFFTVLRIVPHLGRLLTAEEEVAGRDRVAILSHAFWQRRFASDPGIVGRIIHVDGEPTVVIGVLPPAARFVLPGLSANTGIFVPPTRSIMTGRRVPTLQVVGRLKPDVSPGQAQAEMDAIASHLERESPKTNSNRGIRLTPLVEEIAGAVRPALLLILSAVGCVLLIACGNVANLLLARMAARGRELGVRVVLGAGRARLTRQMLAESLLLAGAGGLAGVLISSWGARTLAALTPAGQLPRSSEVGLDWRVTLFGLGLSLAAGLLLGLAPAVGAYRLATHGNLAETLKAASAGSTTVVSGQRLRRALIVGEVALSLMLLAATGLLIRSFIHLRAVDLGFRPENLLIATVSLPQGRYKEPAQRGAFAGQVLERLQSVPGIEAAAFTNTVPLAASLSFSTSISIEGRPDDKDQPIVSVRSVTPDYFRAVGVPLKRGRLLTGSDGAASEAVLINDTMARRFWPPGSPDSDPIGRRIHIFQGWRQIAGVVGDVRSSGPQSDPVPEIYAPIRENPLPVLTLVVRTPAEPMTLVPSIRAVVRSIDADLPLERVGTMERVLYSATAGPRFQMTLIAVFAAIALALAAIGLYGVVSYSVAQRTRELGIRMALGAERADVLGMVLRQGMTLALAGVGLGLAGALGAGKLLATFLFGVKPADPVTLAAVSLLMFAIAALASYIPARRATRLDPMAALRYE